MPYVMELLISRDVSSLALRNRLRLEPPLRGIPGRCIAEERDAQLSSDKLLITVYNMRVTVFYHFFSQCF